MHAAVDLVETKAVLVTAAGVREDKSVARDH